MRVPAVTIDITDDGRAYTITATPWPTLDSTGHTYRAVLVHTVCELIGDSYLSYPTKWTAAKIAAFVKKLMKAYPSVTV